MTEEFVCLDVCRESRSIGIGTMADTPSAVRMGMALDMAGHPIRQLGAPESAGDAVTLGFGDGRYLHPRCLWQNETPTVEFAPQTVTVDLSGCGFILIVVRYSTAEDIRGSRLCPAGGRGQCLAFSGSLAARSFTALPEGIAFESGKTASGEDNSRVIPLEIWSL